MNIGDLVQSRNSGKVGVITALCDRHVNFCYVMFHDKTYSVHTSNLKPLEKK
jgi:hypothetical protein